MVEKASILIVEDEFLAAIVLQRNLERLESVAELMKSDADSDNRPHSEEQARCFQWVVKQK